MFLGSALNVTLPLLRDSYLAQTKKFVGQERHLKLSLKSGAKADG